MSLKYFLTFAMMLLYLIPSFGQLDSVYYQWGVGSVSGGATQTTDNFSDAPIPIGELKIIPNPEGTYTEPMFAPTNGSETLPPYVYVEDPNATENPQVGSGQTVLLQKFPGVPMTNYIPPDCIMAVGPNHVIACVNSQFSIWDKQGNLLKSISAAQWWLPAWPDEAGDPQVIYDQFAGRWVLVWMQYNDVALTAGNLIAYSDDDDPLGTWYMYRLDTKTNGTVQTNNWGDYPQLGYDDEAIYIMTRAFGFAGGGPFYSKFRVISKADLYTNSTGPLTYKDFWDIGLPGTPAIKPDGIHPSYCYTAGEGGYFFWANRSGGNYYAVYKFLNPTSSAPRLRGDTLRVQNYFGTPDANQLGGGSPLIASNGSHVKTSPVIRDGKMYIAHSVGNTTSPAYASAKYVIYDLPTNSIVEQAELGAAGYYYIFPTITVDKDHNIAVTYSRSATTEYIGAFYSTKYAGEHAGLSPSQPLAEGLGNYVVTYGGTRNRWGDYLGICIDPSNEYDIWLFPEYASGTNAWGTMIGQIRMVPFTGIYVYSDPSITDTLDFGRVEVGLDSDPINVTLSNYGLDSLVITDIPDSVGDFHLLTQLSFPIVLNTYDSLTLSFLFTPTTDGEQIIDYPVTNNSADFTSIPLKGFGWKIYAADNNQLYAISGLQNSGNFVSINKLTGQGTDIGPSLFTDIKSIAIKPDTNLVYAMRSNTTESEILKVNAQGGDSYSLLTLPIPNLYTIAFDKDGLLFGITTQKTIYRIDLETALTDSVSTIAVMPISVAFDPTTNQLWGTYRKTGTPKDLTVKIDLVTGDTVIVGSTGFGMNTTDIAFDETGVLYGIKGIGATVSDLFTIDKSTGVGTIVGSIGLKDIRGLAYSYDEVVVSVDNEEKIPMNFSLEQNYPNPFNPSTQIKFSLPVNSNVKLIIYNLLGEVVNELVNKEMNSGTHSIQWNADDVSGKKVSSGIYFYELNAAGVNGNQFNQVRKMILLK